MEVIWQDIRLAIRKLYKHRSFSIMVILALAIGIGANTTIFSVVYAVLLKPLPFKESDKLVRIEERHSDAANANFTFASFIDLERYPKSLESIAALREWQFNLSDIGEPEQVQGALVSSGFFETLGALPQI